jgi:aspartate kinase
MMVLNVAKFGGTSMGSAEALRNAADILARDPASRLAVVSACSGVTNQLIALAEAELAGNFESAASISETLRLRHTSLASDLGLSIATFEGLFRELEDLRSVLRDGRASGEIRSPRWLDQVLSLGERLSSELFAAFLRAEGRDAVLFDARTALRTDSLHGKAEPDVKMIAALSREHLAPLVAKHEVVITQGFLGSNPAGITTTLGRGGSDYSAALFAEALGAQSVFIWTDVPGVFTLDPNVAPAARPIQEISFAEAAELANFGAKVLHPSTLLPAMRGAVPVFVGSTFRAGELGTWIRAQVNHAPLARAIALRKKQTLITVTSLRMLNAHGFLAHLFQTLADHCLSVDLVTTSEVSVAMTVDGTSIASGALPVAHNHELLDKLREVADVTVEEDLTLVALIGNRLTTTPGVALRALRAAEPDNVRLLCHGASPQNLCFLVAGDCAENIARRMHAEFLEGGRT